MKYKNAFQYPVGIKFAGPINPAKCHPSCQGCPGTFFSDDIIKTILESSFQTDWRLTRLVEVYKNTVIGQSETQALAEFWRVAENLYKDRLLSEEEKNVLCDAEKGELKAVQLLVRNNPDIIILPFIQTAMNQLLQQYKYKTKDLINLKDIWCEFLPYRGGGKIQFLDEHVSWLYEVLRKEGLNQIDAIQKISTSLNVSEEWVRKHIHIKSTPGRPKKISK